MRGKFPKKSIGIAAIAMAAGLGLTGYGLTVTPAFAAKAAKKGAYSKEFVAVAGPIQEELKKLEQLKAGGADQAQLDAAVAAALPKVEAAVGAAAPGNNDDKMAAGQFLLNLGSINEDNALRKRGVSMMVESGQIEPEKLPTFQFYLGNFAYATKDYPAAAAALKAAVAGGFQNDAIGPLLVDAYGQAGQGREGLAAFKQAVASRKAAGLAVPDSWFNRASLVAYNNKLGPEAIEVATMSVSSNPTKQNWLNAAQMVRTFGGLDVPATLDLFRLMDRSGALDNDPKFVRPEYKEYIESADPRRLPGEVVRVIDKGLASGALVQSDGWVAEARQNASGRVASDKASLAGEVSGAKAAGGVRALGLGDAFLSYGNAAQAEELYKAALNGADANVALTRLGIAQYDQGKYAEAKANFEKVTGPRQPVARLWLALIGSKGVS
jgi:tetratricopeptide (TPR) repeat protein